MLDPEINRISEDINQLAKQAEQWASPRREELFSKGKTHGIDHLRLPIGQPISQTRSSKLGQLHACTTEQNQQNLINQVLHATAWQTKVALNAKENQRVYMLS